MHSKHPELYLSLEKVDNQMQVQQLVHHLLQEPLKQLALLHSGRHHSRNFGPGDLEEVSQELWEELRLDNAGAEYDLGRDQAEEEGQRTSQVLDRAPGLSEAAGTSTASN